MGTLCCAGASFIKSSAVDTEGTQFVEDDLISLYSLVVWNKITDRHRIPHEREKKVQKILFNSLTTIP
jgi:hypothetical protein